jgi:ABC-type bacteriocin/lantibiotic exporter with double-glycine peptidase domain
LQIIDGEKSKISPIVGSEHVAIGNWLSISVVGVALLGMAYPIFSKFLKNDVFSKDSFRAFSVIVIFIAITASYTFLFKAKVKMWRNIFAVLTSVGLIVLGAQPEVFRRDNE